MATARYTIVDESRPGFYHCISRCVRQAYLCGFDKHSGNDYEHRRGWVRARLRFLSEVFGIDVFAYAVMKNHLHVVLRNDPDLVASWSDEEVARRWLQLFPAQRDENGSPLVAAVDVSSFLSLEGRVEECRQRLGSLSWFMRCLNETIARWANREDGCKGRFWEGRFHCQRLADDGAVLACMSYVDLNPVRAGAAETLEASDFTSVQDRLLARQARARRLRLAGDHQGICDNGEGGQDEIAEELDELEQRDSWLGNEQVFKRKLAGVGGAAAAPGQAPESGVDSVDGPRIFPRVPLKWYLELLDWTGRQVRLDKAGAIPHGLAPVMKRLELDTEEWVNNVKNYGELFQRVAGTEESLERLAAKGGQRWFKGLNGARCLFAVSDSGG